MPLMAVDLDGTYINCNSLRVYLRCGLQHSLCRLRLLRLLRAVLLLSLRALKLISHTTMKWGCISALGRDEELVRKVGVVLRCHIDQRVKALVDDWQAEGKIAILATAAPDFYIPEIWQHDFIATDIDGSPANECRGEEKLRRVQDYATERNYRLEAVVTDHKDDMPLIKYNAEGKNILVNPTGLRFL